MKYPASGLPMASSSTSSWKMPAPSWSADTRAPSASGSSSFSLPLLKSGATGNTLYPAPRSTSPSYPSLSSLPKPSAQSSSGNASSASSRLTMPSGFSSAALGGSGSLPLLNQKALSAAGARAPAAQSAAPAQSTAPMPSRSVPAATTAANARAINNAKVTQGSLTYTPLANSNMQSSAASPTLRPGAANPAPGSMSTGVDQYGRQFNYAASVDGSGGQVVGLSANGTVLKQVTTGNGQTVIYDTGATATAPRAAAPTRPAAPPTAAKTPVVGRPTQVGQPVVVGRPAPPQPTQDDLDTFNQGNWLA